MVVAALEARPGGRRLPMACQRRAWARQADGSGRDTQADRQSRALRSRSAVSGGGWWWSDTGSGVDDGLHLVE